MRIGVPDDGNAPTDTTQRIAYDQLAAGFGPGFNGPIQVVVELPDRRRTGGRRSGSTTRCAADPGVAAVTAPVLNAAGDTAVLTANPTTAPQDERTDQLVRHLRADVLPATVDGTDAQGVAHRPGDGHRPDRPHHRAGCRCSSPPSWRCRSSC